MLRQGILTDIAVIKAKEILQHNPIAGEMWEGQLQELLQPYLSKD